MQFQAMHGIHGYLDDIHLAQIVSLNLERAQAADHEHRRARHHRLALLDHHGAHGAGQGSDEDGFLQGYLGTFQGNLRLLNLGLSYGNGLGPASSWSN